MKVLLSDFVKTFWIDYYFSVFKSENLENNVYFCRSFMVVVFADSVEYIDRKIEKMISTETRHLHKPIKLLYIPYIQACKFKALSLTIVWYREFKYIRLHIDNMPEISSFFGNS